MGYRPSLYLHLYWQHKMPLEGHLICTLPSRHIFASAKYFPAELIDHMYIKMGSPRWRRFWLLYPQDRYYIVRNNDLVMGNVISTLFLVHLNHTLAIYIYIYVYIVVYSSVM